MGSVLVSVLVFLAVTAAALAVLAWRNGEQWQLQVRLRGLSNDAPAPQEKPGLARRLLSRLPAVGERLLPGDERHRGQLQRRLTEAGIYGRNALAAFLGVKLLLVFLGGAIAAALGLAGVVSPVRAGLAAVCLCGLAIAAPGLWLDGRKRKRQTALRRGLPDFLDMLVLCVEGGVSLAQGVQRVTAELHGAHAELGYEIDIVQSEMLLGLSVGEALRKFGDRADLEDMRTLASVLLQNERYGASVAKALRVHADTLRLQRQQRAEELAQKAAVKVLLPTLLCIFPAIFIVILGPAALQIVAVFSKMKGH